MMSKADCDFVNEECLDYAEWAGYMHADVVFYSNKVINRMITDLLAEKRKRNFEAIGRESNEVE